MEQIEREIKSFKEVHVELEMESSLLGKNHNINDFKNKGGFLREAGFTNSIATKLYTGIAENHHLFDEYSRKYQGRYKFILRPQLERICEKYNLYVRQLGAFLGDIPEPNIREIMNFKIHLEDIPLLVAHAAMDILSLGSHNTVLQFSPVGGESHRHPYHGYSIDMRQYEKVLTTISLADSSRPSTSRSREANFGDDSLIRMEIDGKQITEGRRKKLAAASWVARGCEPLIAAVKELFTEESMENPRRIVEQSELMARGQVDLDPIVLFPVYKPSSDPQRAATGISEHNGYLIVTAWGDEANDELVVNQTKN